MCGVHGFAEFHRGLDQCLGLLLDGLEVFAILDLFKLGQSGFDGFLVSRRNLVAELFELLFGLVDHGFRTVMGLNQLTLLLVFVRVALGVLDHGVNIIVGQTTGGLDADRLFLAGRLVLGGHVDDTIGVDVEGDLDLRHAAWCRRNADQIELTQQLVIGCHFALALRDADGHGGLVVVRG